MPVGLNLIPTIYISCLEASLHYTALRSKLQIVEDVQVQEEALRLNDSEVQFAYE